MLHSGLAVAPEDRQPLGLLWRKLWNRTHPAPPPVDETPSQKKQRQTNARKVRTAKLALYCAVELRAPCD
ncbi:MAG: hypothetical protein F6K30_09390 [Cyanothece sp. SIO2G6]|nr:hypothetical protein [Cyanothece sp. SIO2G6]